MRVPSTLRFVRTCDGNGDAISKTTAQVQSGEVGKNETEDVRSWCETKTSCRCLEAAFQIARHPSLIRRASATIHCLVHSYFNINENRSKNKFEKHFPTVWKCKPKKNQPKMDKLGFEPKTFRKQSHGCKADALPLRHMPTMLDDFVLNLTNVLISFHPPRS